MRFLSLLCLLVALHPAGRALAPRAACLAVRGVTRLAALDDGRLRLAWLASSGLRDAGVMPATGIATLAVGRWHGAPAFFAARGRTLLRLDLRRRTWRVVGRTPAPIREIHPFPRGAAALLLTGNGASPPADGALYAAYWERRFRLDRVTAVKSTYRPWQCEWFRAGGEDRLAVATFKATHFAPFLHNCLFTFAWSRGQAEPRWLGSRLTRPYLDVAHADMRAGGDARLVAVETTRDGGHGLSVYRPAGFGYAGEWRTDTIPDLARVAACGDALICWGGGADAPRAWQLAPAGTAYRLVSLPAAPPAPEALARLDRRRLAGWWNGSWHIIALPGQT